MANDLPSVAMAGTASARSQVPYWPNSPCGCDHNCVNKDYYGLVTEGYGKQIRENCGCGGGRIIFFGT